MGVCWPRRQAAEPHGQAGGRYYGPPATWESLDGSKLTATQLAVAPAMAYDAANMGSQQTVNDQADYIFWKVA